MDTPCVINFNQSNAYFAGTIAHTVGNYEDTLEALSKKYAVATTPHTSDLGSRAFGLDETKGIQYTFIQPETLRANQLFVVALKYESSGYLGTHPIPQHMVDLVEGVGAEVGNSALHREIIDEIFLSQYYACMAIVKGATSKHMDVDQHFLAVSRSLAMYKGWKETPIVPLATYRLHSARAQGQHFN